MITRSLLVVVAILLFASPAFTQFGQSNNRLTDLAARLVTRGGRVCRPQLQQLRKLARAITATISKP